MQIKNAEGSDAFFDAARNALNCACQQGAQAL